MNSITYLRTPRSSLALTAAQLVGIGAVALAFTGCGRRPIIVQSPPATVVQTQAPAPSVGTSTPAMIVVKEAPPPPRDEPPPPPPPSSQYSWVPGYWSARDGHPMWVPGRYEMPPRTGATWVPPRWERRDDGYVYIEGYWR